MQRAVIAVAFCIAVELFSFFQSCAYAQTTSNLDTDIASVKEQIASTESENEKYAGGLIKSLILLRIEILKNSLALLEQKKFAGKNNVAISYTYNGSVYKPVPADESVIKSLEADIARQRESLSRSEAENARYSGGLIKATILSTMATINNTIALLEQRLLFAKHGIAMPGSTSPKSAAETPKSPGRAVQDSDAF